MVDLHKDSPSEDAGPNDHDWWAELLDLSAPPPAPTAGPAGASPEPARATPVLTEPVGWDLPALEFDDVIGTGQPRRSPGPPRPRRRKRPARPAALVLVTGGSLLAWWQLGGAYAVAAAAVGLLLLAVARVGTAAHRWRPLAGRRRLVARLPLVVFLVALAALLTGAVRSGWSLAAAALSARSVPLRLPVLSQGSTVYDAEGQVVAVFHGQVNRQAVKLSAVAPVMVKAVVDTEDARFWSHGGVDVYGTVRAGVHDLFGHSGRQGGSTLAMQLVKNVYLDKEPDGMRKKVQEAVLADRLEDRIGKAAVLQEYLNTVYFGEGAYGVQAAAEEYFAEPASRLDAAQAALLAGLIQDPVGYDPLRDPAAALHRRRIVLGLMVAHHSLSPAQAEAAAATPLPHVGHPPPNGDNYFMAAVRQELLADPALGPTPAARYQAVFYGGLQIHTTLEPSLEEDAMRAVGQGLPSSPLHLSAALVSIDPNTGAVRAVVGGPSFASSQFDAALASPGRPTGSSFKVFTLVAALEEGYDPQTEVDGTGPCDIQDPGFTPDPWVLNNYEGEASGWISLTTATANSVNCAYARLAMTVGLGKIAQVARSMGVEVPLAVVPSMTLGTNDVPPVQMASAYATLADGGVYHRPYLVSEVKSPTGQVLVSNSPSGVRVLSPLVADTATSVLRAVVTEGTGTAAAVAGQDIAGKTGTGSNWSDAWFVGYSRYLSTAVWMGAPSGEVPMLDVEGVPVTGGSFPAQIWHSFMAAALAGRPDLAFPAPSGPIPGGPGSSYIPDSYPSVTGWCGYYVCEGYDYPSQYGSSYAPVPSAPPPPAPATPPGPTTTTSTTVPAGAPPTTPAPSTTTTTDPSTTTTTDPSPASPPTSAPPPSSSPPTTSTS